MRAGHRLSRRLRRLLPRTLWWRAMLIVVLPLVLLQVILTVVFYNRHWDAVTSWLASGVAGEVAMAVEELEADPDPAARAAVLDRMRRHLGLAVSLDPGGRLEDMLERIGADSGFFPHIDAKIREAFEERLDLPFALDLRPGTPGRIAVYVQLPDGLLTVLAPRKRVTSTTTGILLAWMVGASLVLLALAVHFMNLQIRPLRRLVRAMDSFGKGRDVGGVPVRGPLEIRKAARAFNSMRRRIERFVQQRTEMLAAVSHDLRTPLTRMRLELELLDGADPETVRGLRRDVDVMQRIVETYLAFARGEDGEQPERIRLDRVLEELARRVPADGVRVELAPLPPLELPLRPVAIRRALANLLDNAVRHARARVRISAAREGDRFEVVIDDDGPGIPPEERERAFRPFHRLQRARGGEGASGLGLAIARDIVLAHGGDIHLLDSPLGGLRVRVELPA